MAREILHISDPDRLPEIEALLHDERFELDGIKFDHTTGTLEIPCQRAETDAPERLVAPDPQLTTAFDPALWKTYEKDLMQSLVTIHHVTSWEAIGDQGINRYSFLHWTFSDGILEIEANEVLRLRCVIGQIDISVTDLGNNGTLKLMRGPGGMEIG